MNAFEREKARENLKLMRLLRKYDWPRPRCADGVKSYGWFGAVVHER